MERVYISAGSNLGDRKKLLQSALDEIGRQAGKVVAVSSMYETEPVGFSSENMFLNQVFAVDTQMFPGELLKTLLHIEKELGRVRSAATPEYDSSGNRVYRSRPIDLDILMYGSETLHTGDLEIPHPRMCERAFVMLPLKEIAPDLIVPGSGSTVSQIVESELKEDDLKSVNRL